MREFPNPIRVFLLNASINKSKQTDLGLSQPPGRQMYNFYGPFFCYLVLRIRTNPPTSVSISTSFLSQTTTCWPKKTTANGKSLVVRYENVQHLLLGLGGFGAEVAEVR